MKNESFGPVYSSDGELKYFKLGIMGGALSALVIEEEHSLVKRLLDPIQDCDKTFVKIHALIKKDKESFKCTD